MTIALTTVDTSTAYLFQSSTSEKGMTKPSISTTGIQPALSASENAVCPSRAPRRIKQNVASYKKMIHAHVITMYRSEMK